MGTGELKLSPSQQMAVDFEGNNLLVSAAAGSGKTAVLVERIMNKILGCPDENGQRTRQPAQIDSFLIVTFTKAAAAQMKEKIEKKLDALLLEGSFDEDIKKHLERQTILVHNAQISTLHSFCSRVIKEHFQEIDLDPSYRMGDETEMLLMKNDIMKDVIEEAYKTAAASEDKENKFYHFIENYCTGKNDAVLESMLLGLYDSVMSHPWPKEWISNKGQDNALSYLRLVLENARYQVKNARNFCEMALKLCDESGGPDEEYKPAILDDLNNLFNPLDEIFNELDGGREDECNKTDEKGGGEDGCNKADEKGGEEDGCNKADEREGAGIECNKADEREEKGNENHKLQSVYIRVQRLINNFSWEKLGRRKKETDVETAERVKNIRSSYKEQLKKLGAAFFVKDYEEILEEEKDSEALFTVLRDLLLSFIDKFSQEKRGKGILDFNDLEHLALSILTDSKNGKAPSRAAIEYRDSFSEIMVDEYQDSNEIQEAILKSISKNNLFMVGDVKQSIYRFRMAKPELFENKHQNYLAVSVDDIKEQGSTEAPKAAEGFFIELSNNYRSRDMVLDSVNDIFRKIMEKNVGNIDYTKEVQLNYTGRTFKNNEKFPGKTEVILGNCGDDKTAVEMEAHMIAQRIGKMLSDGETIIDEKTGSFRRIVPGDIVILLRSMKDISDVFLRVLMQYGIAAECKTTEGYFQTEEVKTACNILKIIDNPRQDIPLCAVMMSPVFNFTDRELALIRIGDNKSEWFDAVNNYGISGEDAGLKEKCESFLSKLNEWRKKSHFMTVRELLEYVYYDSEYMDLMTVKKGGEKRRENLKLLLEKAADFEKTSYSGLYHFNRYIEKILTYEIDYGEAGTEKDFSNAVAIMSIHKSKGLEFPVVFVSNLGRKFNSGEIKPAVLFNSELGFGTDIIDEKTRIKKTTLKKQLIRSIIKEDSIGEEIRILYVAFTRAKERLILTGCGKDIYKKEEGWKMSAQSMETDMENDRKVLSYYDRLYAGNRLDMIMPVLYALMDEEGAVYKSGGEGAGCKGDGEGAASISNDEGAAHNDEKACFELKHFKVLYQGIEIVTENESMRQESMEQTMKELMALCKAPRQDEEKMKWLEKINSLPAGQFLGHSGKVSVSEIKERKFEGLEEEDIKPVSLLENTPPVPKFLNNEEELGSAQRGTVFHKVMQYLDYSTLGEESGMEDILAFLNSLEKRGILTEKEEGIFLEKNKKGEPEWKKIQKFLHSGLAKRMKKADKRKELYREYPFVLGVPESEVYGEGESLILVQGIIDAFFFEGNDVVLVDYKTDWADPRKKGKDLVKKYEVQMKYYKRALLKAFEKDVKEVYLYSFGLDREIKTEI